ncbi:hypothetical protein BV898_04644 [Hypsibius exemplaris]|uniref:Cadherin domain-containing protein n=1 Tax=Hypsibius exemplaris TaxID=2072580 RepID=A0A1W0X1R5_HYPEX|nr:hypothetical protein BV898_04644 [Hypsibius exemplaris]
MMSLQIVVFVVAVFVSSQLTTGRVVVKRQTFAFTSSVYSFTLSSYVPGTIVGKLGTTLGQNAGVAWRVTTPNNNVAIDYLTGQLVLINYLQQCTAPQVVTVTATNSASVTLSTNVIISVGCNTSSTSSTSTTGSPVFAVTSYTLTTSVCTLKTLVGTVSATSSTGLATVYAVVGATAYFYVGPFSGQLFLTGIPPTSTTSFTVSATNSAGTASVPVTVTTSCTTTTVATSTAATTVTAATTATVTVVTTGTTPFIPTPGPGGLPDFG